MGSVTGDAPQPGETPRTRASRGPTPTRARRGGGCDPTGNPAQPLAETAARRHRRRARAGHAGHGTAPNRPSRPRPWTRTRPVCRTPPRRSTATTDQGYAESDPPARIARPVRPHARRTRASWFCPNPCGDRPTDSGFAPRSRARSQATPGRPGPGPAPPRSRTRGSGSPTRSGPRPAAPGPSPSRATVPPPQPGPDEALRGKPPAHRPRAPHRTAPGLIALVALGLIAAFFSWVSAEPFWLAVGHGDPASPPWPSAPDRGSTPALLRLVHAADGGFAVPRVTPARRRCDRPRRRRRRHRPGWSARAAGRPTWARPGR